MIPVQMPTFNRLYPQAKPTTTLSPLRLSNNTGDVIELRFAAKKASPEMVQARFMDARFEVPKAVVEARNAVKLLVTQEPDGAYAISNAIAISDELFLTVAHGVNPKVDDNKFIGDRVNNNDDFDADPAVLMDYVNATDMAVVAVEKSHQESFDCTPIKLAKGWMPRKNDPLYIVAGHSKMVGTQIIPATFTSRDADFGLVDAARAKEASHFYELYCDLLPANSIHPGSFSGGAVVNAAGELVGMLARAESHTTTNVASGRLFFIPVHSLRRYLGDLGALA